MCDLLLICIDILRLDIVKVILVGFICLLTFNVLQSRNQMLKTAELMT